MRTDIYLTLAKPSEQVLFKDRGSKFYGYTFPVAVKEEIKPIIEELRAKHVSANHFCYAWQLGVEDPTYRANDDGEPNNSAGMPIYGQIQAANLTNVLIVVVRIFGGTKLGVGGLIQAYRETAKLAIGNSVQVKKVVKVRFQINFEYPMMNQVMRIIKQKELQIVAQHMELQCKITVLVRQRMAHNIEGYFESLSKVQVKELG
ncbi:MAG: YigZ family protein [Croceitalea sp.]|nr:YigZ family protein [Croceitalea sp.]